MEKEELKKLLDEINSKVTAIEIELIRNREIKENSLGLVPIFVESSPQVRTYSAYIEDALSERRMGGRQVFLPTYLKITLFTLWVILTKSYLIS